VIEMAGEKKLYDNLYKVIKANSGAISANDVVATEILDLQIPRGYCARIRKVIFNLRTLGDQDISNIEGTVRSALVLDADDENSTYIPTFEIDHDVLCDFYFELQAILQAGTEDFNIVNSLLRQEHKFDEDMDVVTVRNIRHNSLVHGLTVGGDTPPQVEMTVYFTYEKISLDLYAKLLGIS